MRRKHVPQRSCIGCRQVRPKRAMIRVIRTPAGAVEIDETGKKSGRGAYICPNRECWSQALERNRLEHALRTTLRPAERMVLSEFGQSLQAPAEVTARFDGEI